MKERPNCVECGSPTTVQTKTEASCAKFWFNCLECNWMSRTFIGPHRPESEIDEIGFERHQELCVDEALDKAEEITQDDFY